MKEKKTGLRNGILICFIIITGVLEAAPQIGIISLWRSESYVGKGMAACILFLVFLFISGVVFYMTTEQNRGVKVFNIVMLIVIIICSVYGIVFHDKHMRINAKFSYIAYKYFDFTGEDDYAVEAIVEAYRLDQRKILYLKECGRSYAKKQDYGKSIYYYDKALELKPESNEIIFLKGCTYYEKYLKNNNMADLENAIQDLSAAVNNQPDKAEYNYKLAHAYYSKGLATNDSDDYNYSVKYFTVAIDSDLNNVEYYFWRANAYLWLGRNKNYSRAIEDFSKAIEFQPDNADFYYWRGRAYVYTEEYSNMEKAIDDFTEAIKIDDSISGYYFWMGKAYFTKADYELEEGDKGSEERYEGAIDNFDKAIDMDATQGEYYYWRAKANLRMENTEAAEMNIQEAIKVDGENSEYHSFLADMYLKIPMNYTQVTL